jgi:hypothetical protein
VNPGGNLILFGPFNPNPVDVIIRLRLAKNDESEWMPGWNIHSISHIQTILKKFNKRFSLHPFPNPSNYPESSADPLSTRQANLDGQTVLINGACLILPMYLLEVSIEQ